MWLAYSKALGMVGKTSVICDLTYCLPYIFQPLSPPAYNLVASLTIGLLVNASKNLSKVLIAPPLISFNTAPSSDVIMFSSIVPSRISFSTKSNNFSLEIFPLGNISSNTILNESVTLALPPMWPLANGKNPAEYILRTCVCGENTVLPIWVKTLNCNKCL